MYCFIPSWYSQKEKWYTRAIPWYQQGTRMEFDDTINQIKAFQNAGEQVKLLILGVMPELRNFLHREGIHNIDIWSAFDVIQGIHGQKAGLFSYKDINWPNDLEWVYTPFLAVAYRRDRLYAKVEFGEGGQMIRIDLFRNEKLDKRFYVDDRGFFSYLAYYSGEKEVVREYYNRNNQWQIREDVNSGKILVNSKAEHSFAKAEYPDMKHLVSEILMEYLRELNDNDTFIVASDSRHNQFIRQLKENQKIVFSFFEKRNFPIKQDEILREDIDRADLIITDTEHSAKELRQCFNIDHRKILDISPYDARVSLGKSQTIKALKILCYIGDINIEESFHWIDRLLEYVNNHKNTVLIIGLGVESEKRLTKKKVEDQLEELILVSGYQNVNLGRENQAYSENEVKREVEKRVFVQNCKTETEIIGILKDIRIVIDIGLQPDLYMQIAGVSAGVPQILRLESRYVEHKKNGWILKNMEELEDSLNFFLDGLSNWNHALVYSIRKIAQYTNGEMVQRWKIALSDVDNFGTLGDADEKTDNRTADRRSQLGNKISNS